MCIQKQESGYICFLLHTSPLRGHDTPMSLREHDHVLLRFDDSWKQVEIAEDDPWQTCRKHVS